MNYRNHLTKQAMRAIEFAHFAAQKYNQDYVGTEHILLGLIHEKCLAATAMTKLGLTFEKVAEVIGAMASQESGYPADNPSGPRLPPASCPYRSHRRQSLCPVWTSQTGSWPYWPT